MRLLKILLTSEFYHPSKGGAQEVVKQLAERLAHKGHDITVATTVDSKRKDSIINGVRVVGFDISGNQVRGFRGNLDSYKDFVLSSGFDVLLNYAAQQWTTDLLLPLLSQIKAKKILVPCGFSGLPVPEYREYFEKMPEWLKQYDCSVYLSKSYRDIEFAKSHHVKNIQVIPNGCGKDEFSASNKLDIRKRLGIPADHLLILHVGSHTGLKGHSDLFRIFSRSKVRNATLLLVANSFGNGCEKRCEIRKWLHNLDPRNWICKNRAIIADLNREETVAAYHEADLFLFPTKIECSPLVLFEAMASRTPFLATDAGNTQEIIEWSGGAGYLLPTTKDTLGYAHAEIKRSAQMLSDLANNPETRKSMAQRGHSAWESRFTWEHIVDEFESLFLKLTANERSS